MTMRYKMSNRTLVELNHDYVPFNEERKAQWVEKMCRYMSSGDPKDLPTGVTFKNIRHHSTECPLEKIKEN